MLQRAVVRMFVSFAELALNVESTDVFNVTNINTEKDGLCGVSVVFYFGGTDLLSPHIYLVDASARATSTTMRCQFSDSRCCDLDKFGRNNHLESEIN